MPVLHVTFDEPPWPDLADRMGDVIHYAAPIGYTALAGGMESGATSVMFRLDLPDGRVVLAETSLALLVAAVNATRVKHPSPPGTGENAP
jgi:hypothetical protein